MTDEEAEAILRQHGVTPQDCVNSFIERLLRERLELEQEVERLGGEVERLTAELVEAKANAIDKAVREVESLIVEWEEEAKAKGRAFSDKTATGKLIATALAAMKRKDDGGR